MKTYTYTDKKDTRSGFGAGMAELGRSNPNVVALCADLVASLKLDTFIKENPGRFIQCGIAEANMIGVSAGLTLNGLIPFATTFANFGSSRVFDQIRQAVAYSNKNVKICVSHAGLTLGEDGATHQVLEDIAMMKALPNMTVINPCDFNQTKAATIAIADYEGPVYLRFRRPVGDRQDFELKLTPAGAGLFVATRMVPPGQWIVESEALRGKDIVMHEAVRILVDGEK